MSNSNQRLKYWVSTVAAVIDPTLPSPVMPDAVVMMDTGTGGSCTTHDDAVTTINVGGDDVAVDGGDTDHHHGTYVPPPILLPPVVEPSTSPLPSPLPNTTTSTTEAAVSSSSSPSVEDNSKVPISTTATATANTTTTNTTTHATTSILFPRLQTWKKQATEAVRSATTTATVSSTGTVTTATAAAKKASALLKQTTLSWTKTVTDDTTSHDVPIDTTTTEMNTTTETDVEEKKDDLLIVTPTSTNHTVHPDPENDDDDEQKQTSADPPSPLPPQLPPSTTHSTDPTAVEPSIEPQDQDRIVPTESNDPVLPTTTTTTTTISSSSPPPSSVAAANTKTTMSLSSTFRSSLQQWSTSVSAVTAKHSTVDHHTTHSMGLPKDVFRGRYSMTTTAATTTEHESTSSSSSFSKSTTTTPVMENQSIRIGKLSSTADHWNQLSSQLQPHEYILLLGRGMLGVNLKQCYKLHHGVYVDYLVPHGSADRSHLVSVGDIITTVGTIDCLKNGTIATVPSIIATATRPVHITFSTSGCFSTNTTCIMNGPNPSMNYVDIAVALLHVAATTKTTTTHSNIQNDNRKLEERQHHDTTTVVSHDRNTETTMSTINNTANITTTAHHTTTNECPQSPVTGESNVSTSGSDETIDTEDSMSLVQPTSFDDVMHHHETGDTIDKDDNTDDMDIILPDNRRVPDLITTKFDMDHLLYPQSPPPSICQSYMSHVAKRNIDPVVFTLDYITATYHCSTNVRCVIQNALIVCIADRRRLAFINRFIERPQEDDKTKPVTDHELSPTSLDVRTTPVPAVKKWNVLLSLFMEMYNFVDLYDIIPLAKQREMVKRMAYKYFLPTVHDNQVQSPPYDFHTIVSDTAIRKLESALKLTTDQYPRTIFIDFQQATFVLLTESVFLPFVISNDCARMRAYLRHTAPYVNVPISAVLSTTCGNDEASSSSKAHAQNYLTYCLVYLLCMMEQEEFGENDDLLLDQGEQGSIGRGARVENAASAICAAIRIKRQILPAISKAQIKWKERDTTMNDTKTETALNESITALMMQLEQLWEIYVAPGVGSLVEGPNPTNAVQSLQMLRSTLMDLQKRFKDGSNDQTMIGFLLDPILFEHLSDLANELIHDYAVRLHPRFRVHKLHEWVCDEVIHERINHCDDAEKGHVDSLSPPETIPAMSSGCVKRMLRKATFPVGITPHQPSHDKRVCDTNKMDSSTISLVQNCNADCAIVFGTGLATRNSDATTDYSPTLPLDNITRYACQSVRNAGEVTQLGICLTPDEIPVTLESYAYVPLSRPKPFKLMQDGNSCSADDWEISLVNFMLPHVDAASQSDEASSIYGVSLMFQYRERPCSSLVIPAELSIQSQLASAADASPISTFDEDEVETDPSEAMNWFDRMRKQYDKSLNDDPSNKSFAIGLALVCQQNHIFAMRETLSLLLQKFTTPSDQSSNTNIMTLINRLGNLANPNLESPANAIHELLEPFLLRGSQPWIERPMKSQANEFLNHAGQQMIQSLPPIPMALMFITALLEQKIVITSNRRSILLSVTTALQELLQPLQWCHLILAHVPAAMASDLLQYPAPFILGLPSSDPGITEMLRELPPDITLIDLDIGRVILAPSFGHDVEFGRRSVSTAVNAGPESNTVTNAEKNIKILRSQVLYLAQCLGNVFGTHLYPSTWCCDAPPNMHSNSGLPSSTQFDTLRTLCHDFIEELLAGTTSCCYWLEEANVGDIDSGSLTTVNNSNNNTVATVLFDEDQFLHIKDARYRYDYTPLFPKSWTPSSHQTNDVPSTTTGPIPSPPSSPNVALSTNEFDYIIELLLRCQSMNLYIGTRQRHDMAYYTK